MKRLLLSSFILIPLFLLGQLYLQEKPLDVPYVPSKPEVVSAMLRMAKVTKDDLLYDLGCGDGRIVITAAQLYGTRGVGIDIDPERIKESQENAAKANVGHLVKFFEQDLFNTDFHEATVVSLYLLTSVNLRLRPILLTQLRPGTRVVSHNYAMDTWKPDDSEVVMVNDISHNVYFWVVPANVSGSWEGSWTEGAKKTGFWLELEQHFQWPSGTLSLAGQGRQRGAEMALSDMSLVGDKFQFTAQPEGDAAGPTLLFSGRATGNEMQGTLAIKTPDGRNAKGNWKVKRDPLTVKPLDIEQ
jgi:SAM-dependent methyltransferase